MSGHGVERRRNAAYNEAQLTHTRTGGGGGGDDLPFPLYGGGAGDAGSTIVTFVTAVALDVVVGSMLMSLCTAGVAAPPPLPFPVDPPLLPLPLPVCAFEAEREASI